MFVAKARLDYHSIWCVAWLDPEIGHYYRSLIPKAKYAQRPMYDAHVTVISRYDQPNRHGRLWGKYQDKEVLVHYDGVVRPCGEYFGLDCWSKDIADLREELGLNRLMGAHWDWPGLNKEHGNIDRYHITVANTKNNES